MIELDFDMDDDWSVVRFDVTKPAPTSSSLFPQLETAPHEAASGSDVTCPPGHVVDGSLPSCCDGEQYNFRGDNDGTHHEEAFLRLIDAEKSRLRAMYGPTALGF